MEKMIRYREDSSDLDDTGISYSDEALIEVIKSLSARLEDKLAKIEMCYMERDEYHGYVFVQLFSVSYDFTTPRMDDVNRQYFSMHEILYKPFAQDIYNFDTWKDCTKEMQREKRIIQKAFPGVKVSSNFH